jgi:hypothetical protein
VSDEDQIKTQVMTKAKWLPPVESIDQLPLEDVEEGTRCFVDSDERDDEEVWEFKDGRWVHLDTL